MIDKNRKFGFTIGGFFVVLGAILLLLGKMSAYYFMVIGGMFSLLASVCPAVLGPVEKGWMKFAAALAWFNTRVILGIAFYLVFTPVGLLMRLFGKDILSLKIEKGAATYWVKREKLSLAKEDYEKIF